MLVSGQNAVRAFRKSWPIVPGLADPVRPLRQVVALEHWEKDLALYLDAHPGFLDCGTDPLVNGGFEVGGAPPAAWIQLTSIVTQEPFSAPGSTGSFCGQVGFDGVNPNGYAINVIAGLALTTTVIYEGWYRTFGGTTGQVTWEGGIGTIVLPASAAWARFYGIVIPTGGANIYLVANGLAAGRWVQYDDVTITPLNVTTWIDRTRRGGRNPTQAAVASRPVRVVGGLPSSRDSIYYDGNAQRLKAPAFTLNQTESVNVVFRHAFQATGRYLLDGNAGDSMALYRPTGLVRLDAYASANLVGPAIVTATWYGWTSVFNGAASSSRQGIGAETAGNVGASNAGGFTLGSVGGGGSYWVGDISSVVVLERLASPSEVINLNASAMRRACI